MAGDEDEADMRTERNCSTCKASFQPSEAALKYRSILCKACCRARAQRRRDEAKAAAKAAGAYVGPRIYKQRTSIEYTPVPESGCWLFSGRWDRKGYGVVSAPMGKKQLAHRFSWAQANGPIPDGMLVCHKCDTPACVNPAHLFLGSCKDNVEDMIRKMRAKPFGRVQRRIPARLSRA